MTDEQTPAAGPLTAESVGLLKRGDWLRVIEAGSFLLGRGLVDGGIAVVRSVDGPYVDVYGPAERSDNRASRFAFLGRPDQDGWIAWHGGENPVPGVRVEVRLRSGDEFTGSDVNAEGTWRHIWGEGDITHYRPHVASPASSSSVVQGEAGGVGRDDWRAEYNRVEQIREQAEGHERSARSTADAQAKSDHETQAAMAWERYDRELAKLNASPQPSGETRRFSVDDLAQEIRRVDGNHSLGAGALAEALMPFLIRPAPVASGGQHSSGEGVYVASRASVPARGEMWRALRAGGAPIISTWIDEDGEGQSHDLGELWERILREVTSAERLILYVEPNDFPLKGAFIEVGMALAAGVPVFVVSPGVALDARSLRPLGSWALHPLVTLCQTMGDALHGVKPAATPAPVASGGQPEPAEARVRELGAMLDDVSDQVSRWIGAHDEQEARAIAAEAQLAKAKEALRLARPYVADLPIVGDADLAIIDAALQEAGEVG